MSPLENEPVRQLDNISPTAQLGRTAGAAVGLLAAITGLAGGELLASSVDGMLSPIIGVGNRAVDLAPPPAKRFAIATFGTNDKAALLIGMAIAIAVFAMTTGILSRRRRWVGVLGLSAFGALGALAAMSGRTGSARAAVPSLLAAAIAIVALLAMFAAFAPKHTAAKPSAARGSVGKTANSASPGATPIDPVWAGIQQRIAGAEGTQAPRPEVNRRGFLTLGAVAAGAVAMGGAARALQQQTSNRAKSAIRNLPLPFKRLAPIPPAAQVTELVGVTPFITPNKDFYRIDTALVVPKVDVSKWTLTIDGMVTRKRVYTYDDLLAMNLIEQDITLTCVSNEVGGILMGNARWLGVPLAELLADAGADPDASQIIGRSVDGWTAGFPTAALKRSRALVAVGMNGDPLPFQHGFPARLVVPGIYGYASATKWLEKIELTTLDAAEGYWVPRGYSKEAPIKMGSRIDVPRGLSTVPAGKTAIAGIAWSQTIGISRVEVKVDNEAWQEATLATEVDTDTWRQWKFEWDATTGQHEITVRAFDAAGKLQTEARVAPLPNGATGWHQVVVFVS